MSPISAGAVREQRSRPLRILICAPDHAGTLNQALGAADALQRSALGRGWPRPTVRRSRFSDPILCALPVVGKALAPDLVLSCGASGERKGRRMKTAARGLLWVHIETLKAPGVRPDLTVIPAHDYTPDQRRAGTMRIAGVPHRIRADALATLRPGARAALSVGEADRVAVFLIGGTNEAFDFDAAAMSALQEAVTSAAAAGWTCLLVPSRRTPPAVRAELQALAGPHIRWMDGDGGLSYRDYLAAADHILVTEDSISMTCEAVASMRRVSRLPLTPRDNARLAKFRRFQEGWKDFVSPGANFDVAYRAAMADIPDDAAMIAHEIERLLQQGADRPHTITAQDL